jgi:uncharacterized damage-inducible protein DinB
LAGDSLPHTFTAEYFTSINLTIPDTETCMKRTTALVAAVLVLAGVGTANAQAPEKASTSPGLSGISFTYGLAKNFLVKTAEQASQEMYSFQPTKDVRTFGALLGHVADASKTFCAMAEGSPSRPEDAGSEKLTDKAALIAALNDAFAYCDKVTAKLTDADLARPVEFFGMKTNVAGVLSLNAAHNYEHYGNLVTYMRMNGMVPPSSQRGN